MLCLERTVRLLVRHVTTEVAMTTGGEAKKTTAADFLFLTIRRKSRYQSARQVKAAATEAMAEAAYTIPVFRQR